MPISDPLTLAPAEDEEEEEEWATPEYLNVNQTAGIEF